MNIFDLKEVIIDFFFKKYNLYEISKCIDINTIYDTR